MIVVSIGFAIERPPYAIVEGDISGDLPLVCQIPLDVMPFDVCRRVNAVFIDIEHLRLRARSRYKHIGKRVIG